MTSFLFCFKFSFLRLWWCSHQVRCHCFSLLSYSLSRQRVRILYKTTNIQIPRVLLYKIESSPFFIFDPLHLNPLVRFFHSLITTLLVYCKMFTFFYWSNFRVHWLVNCSPNVCWNMFVIAKENAKRLLLERLKIHLVFHASYLKPYHEYKNDPSWGISKRELIIGKLRMIGK